jgi:uncharacterized protein (DUF362 family)
MNRRKFLKETVKYGIAAGTAFFLSPYKKMMGVEDLLADTTMSELAAIKGGEPDKMFDAGIKALGGMNKFVKKGQTVVVKPNIGWSKPPEISADTNPKLVYAIVKHCMDAGAKKVYVFDHTCDNWEKCYSISGIADAAKKAGASVAQANSRSYYQNVSVPYGDILKTAEVHELILKSDVFINVPVLKNHGSADLTISMKNLMGIVWDRGFWHANGLHQCIADFAAYRKPDLNVVDAYNVMKTNGPRGVNTEDTLLMKSQIISNDIVAADAAAAKLFGIEPSDVDHIQFAAKKGLGQIDLSKVAIKRIVL